MSKLDEVIEKKIEELDEMHVTDEGFKEASQAVCGLVEAQAKNENKTSRWSKIGTFVLAGLGAISPFVINAFNQRKDDERLDKVLEYEKTGAIMSTGSKHVLSSVFKFKH